MKHSSLAAISALLICFLLPYLSARSRIKQVSVPTQTQSTQAQISSLETTKPPQTEAAEALDAGRMLMVLDAGAARKMDMHTYLVGALLGEMPLSFEPQALCAQAVACRTYALRQAQAHKHGDCAVCTASACCLKWVDPAVYAQENGETLLQKAHDAVQETDGQVLTYDGKLIDATFFSCSGGTTEAAVAVWGSDIAYLQAVDSPNEEEAKHYTDTICVSLEDFRSTLSAADSEAVFADNVRTWQGSITFNESGSVKAMQLGGRWFTGVQLRKLFQLYSTDFELSLGSEAVFTTHGFGHRVGMSQYGANAMAKQGSGYAQILAWYYRGTTLTTPET